MTTSQHSLSPASAMNQHPALAFAVKTLTALKADDFEIFFNRSSKLSIKSRDFKVDALDRAEDLGLAVRLIKNNRQGFSFTTSLDQESVKNAVHNAFRIAEVMPPDQNNNFIGFSSFKYNELDHFDQVGLEVSTHQKIEMAKELEKVCRDTDPRVTNVRSAAISQGESEVVLIDSSGKHIRAESTSFTASITCKAELGEDSQMGGEFEYSPLLSDLDYKKVARLAAHEATMLLGAIIPSTMQCPAVFRNNVVAELLEFMAGSFSAESVDKGTSLLINRLNKPLFSKLIQIFDDGTLPQGYGTSSFDAEGIPTQRTPLVIDGTPIGLLYDLYYAKKFSKKATGNSARGIKSPPSIGITNLMIQPGAKSLNDLCTSVHNGVLITDLMGVHTANPITGDFSLGASGILIENGKLSRPLRGFAVAGNILTLFLKTKELGSDNRSFGSVCAPSLLLEEISISGN